MKSMTVLAIDLGAESGRVMAVHFDGRQLRAKTVHRFANGAVNVRGTLYWDFLELWTEIQDGIQAGKRYKPASLGVDTWGVDFALIDKAGQLLANPICYRDDRTLGMTDKVFQRIPREIIFSVTGIQISRINTLYQIVSMLESGSPVLGAGNTLLFLPDLAHYWLTGTRMCEYTIATTSQMVEARTGQWASSLLDAVGIPISIFSPIVQPGTRLGEYEGIAVIAPATHDTGSAVAAVPAAGADFAYISSGTWSLVGVETREPILNSAALAANVSNEGGVGGTFRLLKNVTGLWILQQCRAVWDGLGEAYEYAELVEMAQRKPMLKTLFDVDDEAFLPPGNHPERIEAWCRAHGEAVPSGVPAIVRAVLESLAMKYRSVLEKLVALTGSPVGAVHIVGGGSKVSLLNQMTANATGLPVISGPSEATALGNAMVQLMSLGEIKDVAEGRSLLALETTRYDPQDRDAWDAAYARYQTLMQPRISNRAKAN